MHVRTEIYTGIFTSAFSLITPNFKEPQHLSTSGYIHTLRYIYIMNSRHKKKQTTDTYNDTDEFSKYHAK